MSGRPEEIVRSYFEARSRLDVEALPSLLSDDVDVGPMQGIKAVREAWSDPYDHLDDVAIVETVSTDGEGVVACWRSELRWRHDDSLAATQERTSRFFIRDGLIARVELVERGDWIRA